MEEIASCDPYGMSCPSGESFVLRFKFEHFSCYLLQERRDQRGCDEAAFALITSVRGSEHGQRLFVWQFEALATLDDTEDGLDWTELWVIEILVIWLDLEVAIVFLLLDAKSKVADIINCEAC